MKQLKKALRASVLASALALALPSAPAQVSDGTIKIGVLSDMSSLYTDIGGKGSEVAARMAVEDFGAAAKGMKVEIISADHQNKADVGSNLARQWYDVDKVDVIVDVPNSGVALAVNQVTREKGKVFLVSGAASADLTGKACSPNTIHWAYDTWMLANGTGNAIVKTGGKRLGETDDVDDGDPKQGKRPEQVRHQGAICHAGPPRKCDGASVGEIGAAGKPYRLARLRRKGDSGIGNRVPA